MICPHCKNYTGIRYNRRATSLAKKYRNLGFSYRDIKEILKTHNIQIGMTSIHRILREPKSKRGARCF